ncbi:MAG: hypothetical protein ACRDPR_03415, partial [Nocardioidaceae bacterium]
MSSEFRLSRTLTVRLFGFLALAGGAVVVATALLQGALGLPGWVLVAGVVLVVAGLGAAAIVLTRVSPVRLDESGYQIRLVRGAGVARARWTDVEDVVATTVARERCVVLRLRDGRSTTLPMRILDVDPVDFVRDLQA